MENFEIKPDRCGGFMTEPHIDTFSTNKIEEIKQKAEEYADGVYDRKLQNAWWQECRQYHIAGAHSRDEEVENLEKLFDKAVHMLRDTYEGSDFFCERLIDIPEEERICRTYCDGNGLVCDCVLRYLKHQAKTED